MQSAHSWSAAERLFLIQTLKGLDIVARLDSRKTRNSEQFKKNKKKKSMKNSTKLWETKTSNKLETTWNLRRTPFLLHLLLLFRASSWSASVLNESVRSLSATVPRDGAFSWWSLLVLNRLLIWPMRIRLSCTCPVDEDLGLLWEFFDMDWRYVHRTVR